MARQTPDTVFLTWLRERGEAFQSSYHRFLYPDAPGNPGGHEVEQLLVKQERLEGGRMVTGVLVWGGGVKPAERGSGYPRSPVDTRN